jgi:TRAP-type C4-dicarboxylate transport system permease small subunit
VISSDWRSAGAAIALFLPWCQMRRGNIIVDFFTARLRARTDAALDRFGALLVALVLALMTWRTTVGGLNAWRSLSGTMMIGFPEWIIYTAMVPPMLLCAVIGLAQALRGSKPGDGMSTAGRAKVRRSLEGQRG